MAFTRSDLRAFYRAGFAVGLGFDRETGDSPTVQEIDEWFESMYKRWREDRKNKPNVNTTDPDEAYMNWLNGVPGAAPPLFPELAEMVLGRRKPYGFCAQDAPIAVQNPTTCAKERQ